MLINLSRKHVPAIFVAIVVSLISAALIMAAVISVSPIGRNVAIQFFYSLRLHRAELVNIDLSSFADRGASPTLEEMIAQMISDKVSVTVNEPDRSVKTRSQASRLAGFSVRLLGKRKDVPRLTVNGKYAFSVSVDRTRLQAILNEADRSDLVLSPSIDGETIAVTVPRTVTARYGLCPGRRGASGNALARLRTTNRSGRCLLLTEGPSPEIRIPPALSLEPFAEIGLEVAGLTPGQARQFLSNVKWKAMLDAPLPRLMRSYESVTVSGVKGTLFGIGGLRGPTYALVWADGGIVYSLVGFGDVASAVGFAESVS